MVTVKKSKFKKHPAKMTSDELAKGVFHPKVLKAAQEHIAKVNRSRKRVKLGK
jgi:hypothetical protein